MRKINSCDIAVIGMSVNYPGASSVEQYWDNISNGKESITHYEWGKLKEMNLDMDAINQRNFRNAAGVIQYPEIDLEQFHFNEDEADCIDSRLKLLLHASDDALQNANVNTEIDGNNIGVFIGTNIRRENMSGLVYAPVDSSKLTEMYREEEYFSNQISYRLELTGPSMVILSACSSSLACVYAACQAIQNGDCEMALAGAVNEVHNLAGYLYMKDSIYSQDGSCRVFDEIESGIVPANGVGMIVLKPLEKAKEDSDTIYAVIKGVSMNNDGSRKLGFTVPSAVGVEEAVRKAIKIAGINPEDINLVEAHGTGTTFGDMLEITGLTKAFATEKHGYCAISSVKPNIGYLDVASGMASLIKALLCTYHHAIVPQINYDKCNPYIDLAESPFYISKESIQLEKDQKFISLVDSIGDGGSNVHVILESFSI